MITEPTQHDSSTASMSMGLDHIGLDISPVPGNRSDLGVDLGYLEFRVVRSGSPVRRMRLNSTRCTLGSGEGCTVRLADPTLRPMHAVVLRDANHVLLRGYTVPIEINGQLTGESFLQLGDRFTLGAYHFELIGASQLPGIATVDDDRPSNRSRPTRVRPTAASEPDESSENMAAPRRSRLSFLGGATYVSEAVQDLRASAAAAARSSDAAERASQRAESDALRREVDGWRRRDRQWKEQETELRDELAEAVDRFQESQSRASEAGQAVGRMRERMTQLTGEMESLSRDSVEFRRHADQRHAELRGLVDHANSETAEARAQIETALSAHQAVLTQLAEASSKIESLTAEITTAARQLEAARREVAGSFARVEQLTVEVARLQQQTRDAREQAASAAVDQQTVNALQSQLAASEASRNDDRLSWEEEALALHDSIQQLSIELATVTGRLSQTQADYEAKQADHESTQGELNEAMERLHVVRRELAARPTTQQWDELQQQLNETEAQLNETEKQLGLLRRNYDELLGRHERASEEALRLAVMTPPASALVIVSAVEQKTPEAERPFAIESKDDDWPTYQSHVIEPPAAWLVADEAVIDVAPVVNDTASQNDVLISDQLPDDAFQEIDAALDARSVKPLADWNNDGQVVEPEDSFEVTQRLDSYTSHDVQSRWAHGPVDDEADVPSAVATDWSSEAASDAAAPIVYDNAIEDSTGPTTEVNGEPAISELARQLIAQLDESRDADIDDEPAVSVSQSHGAWAASSQAWDRVTATAESDENGEVADDDSSWNHVQAPSVWNLANDFEADEPAVAGELIDTGEIVGRGETEEDEPAVSQSSWYGGVADDEPAELDDHTEMLAQQPHQYEAEDEEYQGTRAFDFQPTDANQLSDEEVDEDEPAPEVPLAKFAPAPAIPTPAPDDDSIEAYMNRLLQRVQGQTGTASEPTLSASVTMPQKITDSVTKTAKTTDTVTFSKPTEPMDVNAPLVPRSQAPEQAENMAAMRELANATANSAISQSVLGQAQQLKSKAIMDLMQAGVVLVCAFAFYTCAMKIPSLRWVWMTAAILAFSLSGFFIYDMLRKLSSAKESYDRANSETKEE